MILLWVLTGLILAGINLSLDANSHPARLAASKPANSGPTPTTIIETATMATIKATVQPKKFVDLQDCDFYQIYSTASVLERPFNIADSVNLRQWQAAWRQYGELSRLVNIHRPKLIEQYGAEEFESFLVSLTRLVETPLR